MIYNAKQPSRSLEKFGPADARLAGKRERKLKFKNQNVKLRNRLTAGLFDGSYRKKTC
jgi:hypothetical protein